MMIFLILLTLFLLLGGYFAAIGSLLGYLDRRWANWRWAGRLRGCVVTVALLLSPYLTYKVFELHHVLTRVPEPLNAIWIEYRLEKSWGLALFRLPGDNETGVVVYRLTEGSAQWARSKGAQLPAYLARERRSGPWHPTPVVVEMSQNRGWHRHQEPRPIDHPLNVREYLSRYGFEIPVQQRRIDEANRAIRTPGSFYRYGGGGSITVVDPVRGKVFFAYAG